MTIDLVIENLYNNTYLSNDSKYIYNPGKSNESVYKVNSRYKVSGVNYSPYIITKNFYLRLFSNLILVPNLNHAIDKESLLIETNDIYAISFDPLELTGLMFGNDLTPSGLLAIRARKYFGNTNFKFKVESELSNFMTTYTHNGVEYFVDNNLVDKLNSTTEVILDNYLKSNCFYWRGL